MANHHDVDCTLLANIIQQMRQKRMNSICQHLFTQNSYVQLLAMLQEVGPFLMIIIFPSGTLMHLLSNAEIDNNLCFSVGAVCLKCF